VNHFWEVFMNGREMPEIPTTKRIRLFRLIALLVISLSFVGQTVLSQPGTWKKARVIEENSDILVETRSREGSKSKIDEFRGRVKIKTSLEALVSVMNSFSDYERWLHNCKGSENLEKISDKEGHVYIVYEIGGGFANRDMILHYRFTQRENKSICIDLTGKPNFRGEPKCIRKEENWVRVPEVAGHWTFTPKERGFVEVEYQLHMEPNLGFFGLFDAYANSYVPKVALYTLKNLREEVKEEVKKDKHSSP
jgi:hypothetical protein